LLLDGRRALVTGASSGIGQACAIRLAQEGADVCINYFSDREADAAQAVARQVEAAGRRAIAIRADVGNEQQVVEMVEGVRNSFGGINLVVNNAGIETDVPTMELTLQDWERVLRTNLTGTFLCMRESAKLMRDTGGVIINMSSVHQFIPWPRRAHYCASKGGIEMLTRTAALEWAEHNIRVIAVAPGAIATPINQNVLDDPALKREIEQETAVGRFGKPEEIAAAVVWAASDEARYMTGNTLLVDGGMSLYPTFV
jgi:glucose 1-dehydrogenase